MGKEQSNSNIGPKTKTCILLISLYPSLLTYFILQSNQRLLVQGLVLLGTVLMSYVMAVVTQDYFWLKSHNKCKEFRKDVHIIRPLLTSTRKDKEHV